MKKTILFVDWGLLIVFIVIILSKVINIPFASILQPIFFVLIFIHIVQHWKFFSSRIKKMIKNN